MNLYEICISLFGVVICHRAERESDWMADVAEYRDANWFRWVLERSTISDEEKDGWSSYILMMFNSE